MRIVKGDVTDERDNQLIFENRNKVLKLHGKGRIIKKFAKPLVWVNPGFDIDKREAELREMAPLQYQIKQRIREMKVAKNTKLATGLGKSVNSVSNATKKLLDADEIGISPIGSFYIKD